MHPSGTGGAGTGRRFGHAWRRQGIVVVALAAGIVMSVASFAVVRRWELDHLALDFQQRVFPLAASIETAVDARLAVLRAHANFYENRERIDRHQFHALVSETIARHPGIQAIEWIPRVPAGARAAVEASARAEGLPRGEFVEQGDSGTLVRAAEREEYFPAYYVEPRAGNERAFLFDLGSESARRAALERARATGGPVATAGLTLVQERGTQQGILVFVPVHAPPARAAVASGRPHLRGFVLGVFRVGDLVEAALGRLDASGIAIEVSDEVAPAGERRLSRRPVWGEPARGIAGALRWTTHVEVAGRRWSIAFRPTIEYVAHSAWASWTALTTGVGLTCLIAFLLGAARRRAFDLAGAMERLEAEMADRERTYVALREGERRYRLLADNADDVISVFDMDLAPVYVSPSVTRLRGFTVEEAMRQTLTERLTPASVALVRQALAGAMAAADGEDAGGSRRLELEMPCKDGSMVWVETALSLLRDDAGRPAGVLAVSRDITERKRMADRMRALAEVGRMLSQSLDPDAVGALALDSVCTLLCAASAAIYGLAPDAGAIVLQRTSSPRGTDFLWTARLPVEQSIAGVVLREGRPVVVSDVLQDERFEYPPDLRARFAETRHRAVLAVALQARGRTFGFLAVEDELGRVFTRGDVAVAEAFADQAAIALENARLYADAERRRKTAESLAELERLISRSLDPAEVAPEVAENLGTLLGAGSARVFQLDERSGDLRGLAAWGGDARAAPAGLVLPPGTGVAGLAVRTGAPVATTNLLADPRIELPPDVRTRLALTSNPAILAVPLRMAGRVTGALAVGDREGRVYDESDVHLAETLAHQAAVALEHARLHSEITTRLRHTQALLEVSQAVGSTLDSREAFRRTIRAAVRALGADLGGITAVVAERHELIPLAGYRMPSEVRDRGLVATPAARLLEGLRTRGVLTSSDSRNDPILGEHPWSDVIPHRSMLVAPLWIKGEIVGVMAIAWVRERHEFAGDERDMIEGLARQAAIGIENARLVEQLHVRQRRLEALLETSRQLSTIQPLEDLLRRIAAACGRLLGAPLADFRVVEGDELVLRAAWGEQRESEPILGERLRIADSVSGAVVLRAEPQIVDDLDADTRLVPEHREALRRLGHRAYLGVPVKIGDRVAGVLNIAGGTAFSAEDVAIASAFASQAATAFENARLYDEIRRAYAELTSTQDQFLQAQKMEAIGRLAGGVAHDFNNMMTVVVGRAEILRNRLGPGHPLCRHVDLVRKTADRAAGVARQLLAFSRTQVLRPTVVDLNRLVGGMETLLRPLIGEDVELVTVAGRGLPRVRLDQAKFEQVVVNLAVNARDAMPLGGRLTIETAKVVVDGGQARVHPDLAPGPYVVLAVSDTGCGMDRDTMGRVFEPFFTTKEPGKGTGLGLSMVLGTVKQSGGDIHVESEPGRGTTFRIYLPPADTSDEPGPAAPALPAPAGGTETILLVEDDEGLRDLLTEILTGLGYTVLVAADGEAALAVAGRHAGPIALVLTDVVMPRLSGPEMVQRLTGARPGIRALYMSGYTPGATAHASVFDASTAFIEKPLEPDAVARKVREVLGGATPDRPRGA